MVMTSFDATPRKWGNSLGITLPKELVDAQGLTEKSEIHVSVVHKNRKGLRHVFGTLKFDKPTQELLDEIEDDWK
jgi:antitoxin component of MazEF toxin-antitoxin module